LSRLTGLRIFHNHLSVNAIRPIFDFNSPPFVEVVRRLRLDVFETAMRAGRSLVFTNNSAWGGGDGRTRFAAFADAAADAVQAGGGSVLFVQITAPTKVLEARLTNESRIAHHN
jgi:hypothetical protein